MLFSYIQVLFFFILRILKNNKFNNFLNTNIYLYFKEFCEDLFDLILGDVKRVQVDSWVWKPYPNKSFSIRLTYAYLLGLVEVEMVLWKLFRVWKN